MRRYAALCRDADPALNQVREAMVFTMAVHRGPRRSPSLIVDFLRNSEASSLWIFGTK